MTRNEPTHIAPLFTWRSALAESGLSMTTKCLAAYLSFYMNERGGSAYPGAERLAVDTSMSVRSVRTHLALLEEQGWLAVVERGGRPARGGGRGRATEYVARIPNSAAPASFAAGGNSAAPAPFPSTNGASDDTNGASGAETVHLTTQNGAGAAPQYTNDDSIEHFRNTSRPDSDESGPSSPTWKEAERLTNLLADLIAENGSKRPTVSHAWIEDFDRMLRLDGRDPTKVEKLIRWCQGDAFWHKNILSAPKFREKYDQLRLNANDDHRKKNGAQASMQTHDSAAAVQRWIESKEKSA